MVKKCFPSSPPSDDARLDRQHFCCLAIIKEADVSGNTNGLPMILLVAEETTVRNMVLDVWEVWPIRFGYKWESYQKGSVITSNQMIT
mmetsp:Transcript_20532/g.29311  ORF Transcript_20532/g.29311 Transcript_20532/m.29311 type:complete len:88 (-) Transcript_20532:120-383(-)